MLPRRYFFRVAEETKNPLHQSGGTSSEAEIRHPLGGSVKTSHAAIVFVVVGGKHAGSLRGYTHGETNFTGDAEHLNALESILGHTKLTF